MMIYKPNLFLKVVNWPELIEWFLLSNSTNSPVFSTLSIGYAIPANPGWKPRALAAQLVVDGPHKVTESAGLPAAESPLGTVNYEPYIELDGFWKAWRRWACRTGAGWGYGGGVGHPSPAYKNMWVTRRTCSSRNEHVLVRHIELQILVRNLDRRESGEQESVVPYTSNSPAQPAFRSAVLPRSR